jgi:hypothetical protein
MSASVMDEWYGLQNEGWLKSTKPKSDVGVGAMLVVCLQVDWYRIMVIIS